jgi:hypothetical protein
MLRFLKKHRKSSKKPVPPENPVNQTPDIGTGRGTDSEGEYRSRKISELIRPMGTDSTRGIQIPTAERVLGSQIRTGRLKINSFPHRMPRLRLPGTRVAAQVSAVGLLLCRADIYSPFPISNARTRTDTKWPRGNAERERRPGTGGSSTTYRDRPRTRARRRCS